MEGEGVVEGGGAHLGSSLPMSVHVHGRSSSFVRVRLRSCAFVFVCGWSSSFMCVRLCSCTFVFVRRLSHLFVGGGIRSWVVAFVRGRSHLFVGGRVRVCSWAVVTLARCGGGGPLAGGGGGCSSWPGGGCASWPGGGCSLWPFLVELRGGGVGWLVVANEDDERQRMWSFVVWLPRRTWWVSKRRLGGSVCLLTWAGHDLSPAVDRVCVLVTGDVAL